MLKNLLKCSFMQLRHAGHSKWQNIRHIKGAKDSERAILFLKLSRQMRVAIAEGGSYDVKSNLKLEHVIEQAKRANMPSASIQSVLKSCQNDKSNAKLHLLEIKGPGGCILLCEVLTSSVHGIKQSISTILRKTQTKFSDGGGIHLFDQKGIIIADFVEGEPVDKILEKATDTAIECGAEDVKFEDNGTVLEFQCAATTLKKVATALEQHYKILSANVEYIPLKLQELDEAELENTVKLYEKLEALPEVVRIADNIA